MMIGLCVCSTLSSVSAKTYLMPTQGDNIIGRVLNLTSKESDTLVDIARNYNLGFTDITAANITVDPWLPGEETPLVIPTHFILPNAPYEGIVINLAEMRLYYFPPKSPHHSATVMTYPIGIGREGHSTPLGVTKITAKISDPSWTVPPGLRAEKRAEGIELPRVMPPGPDNPLGRYAMSLGIPKYLIHGTNQPFGIGRRVSYGCIRLYPEDIAELVKAVPTGTRVTIVDQPYKIGRRYGTFYVEAHQPLMKSDRGNDFFEPLLNSVDSATRAAVKHNRQRITEIMSDHSGLPVSFAAREENNLNGKGWFIQVGAYTKRVNVRSAQEQLQANNRPSHASLGKDGYCRVLAGPYAERRDAVAEAEEMGVEALILAPTSPHVKAIVSCAL